MYYFKQIFRSLYRNWLTTVALIFSLCVGFVAFIAISSYVMYENTYDRHFADYQNIYRIVNDEYSDQSLVMRKPLVERALGRTLVAEFPSVLASGFLCKTINPQCKIGENMFTDENVFHASSGLLDVLSIKIVKGKKEKYLTEPYQAIISESAARKYFGDKDPIGAKIFKYPAFEYEVVGVYKDLPKNTHFVADMLLSFHSSMHLPPPMLEDWGETNFYTYIKLNQNTNIEALERNIDKVVYEHKKTYFDQHNIISRYHLQPIKDIHLTSDLQEEIAQNVRKDYLNILFAVSLLLLLASWFNYVYFTYTRVISNVRDIGIQKVLGSTWEYLIKRYVTESLVINTVAVFLSFFVCELIRGAILNTLGVRISLSPNNGGFWITLLAIYLLSIALMGFLPVWMVQRRRPLELMDYRRVQKRGRFSLQHLITIAQFTLIVVVISAIIGIDKQISYLVSRNSGMDISDNLIVKVPQNLRKTSRLVSNFESFEHELQTHPDISVISNTSAVPGDALSYNFVASVKGMPNSVKAAIFITDTNFVQMYNVKLIGGTNFTQETHGCIINISCLNKLGYQRPSEAVGRVLSLNDESSSQKFDVPIAGVCGDFNFQSMKSNPQPLIMLNWTQNMLWGYYAIKIDNWQNAGEVKSFVNQLFVKTFPNYPFEYFWLEDHYKKQYSEDLRLILMLKYLVLLAILVSAINLFSMVWYNTLLRRKEIGIRKVFGATAMIVVRMLNFDFLKWIVFASLIAFPISYFALSKWLERFAYQTALSWWIFVLSSVVALVIGVLTVIWQTVKVANMNPVDSLSQE